MRALTTKEAAEGMTDTFAILFCTVSFTVTLNPFHSFAVSFAMSSPIFLGDSPRGPIFGANEEAAPTSPPASRNEAFYFRSIPMGRDGTRKMHCTYRISITC